MRRHFVCCCAKIVESVFVDAFSRHGATETAQTASRKGKFPQIDHAACKRQRRTEILYHVLQIFIVLRAVCDDDDVLPLAFGDGRERRAVNRFLPLRRLRGRRKKRTSLAGEQELFKEVPRLLSARFAQKIFHVRGKPAHHLQAQIEAVFFDVPVRGDVVKVLGRRDLRSEFSRERYAVLLDQFNETVQLIGRDEGIDGIAKQKQIRLFQRSARAKNLSQSF